MSSKSLSIRISGEFDFADWQRGQQYFRKGAVRILGVGPAALEAEVQGSSQSPYYVRLNWSDAADGVLCADCTCPRFAEMGLCKHLAATILKADEQGIGATVPGKQSLYFEPYDDSDSIDDSSDDESDDVVWLPPAPPPPSIWKKQLQLLELRQQADPFGEAAEAPDKPSRPRQLWYLFDAFQSMENDALTIVLRQRVVKKDGTLGKLTEARVCRAEIDRLTLPEDRQLVGLLLGNEVDSEFGYSSDRYQPVSDFAIAPALRDIILPRLCTSGRFGWLPQDGRETGNGFKALAWDDGPAWKLSLNLSKSADQKTWKLLGKMLRGTAVEELSRPLLILTSGLVIFPDRIAKFDCRGDSQWLAMLCEVGSLSVPVKDQDAFVATVAQMPSLPVIEWPSELRWEEDRPTPLPHLTISRPKKNWETDLECRLEFEYGDRSAPWGSGPAAWYDPKERRAVRRDPAAENAAREQLLSAGARPAQYPRADDRGLCKLKPAKMSRLVLQLSAAGWRVEADGQLVRRAGKLSLSVSSGVDWFDLEGSCDFGGASASLPRLLAALRKGEQFIQLDDGSQGMLPDEWLARFANLVELGKADGDRVRFLPTQAALLDALLAAQESRQVAVDETFARLREKLHSFEGIKPRGEPKSFAGELRHYQREGLGWLHFLDGFAFGGCLADDMGLGKTVQVLALLDERRQNRPTADDASANGATNGAAVPSLAVVPRSLIFNWIEEAKRFAPGLRVLRYVGTDRHSEIDRLGEHDLVVTTYGTLRRDIAKLSAMRFDYAILDEAQAIKNASSQSAKACRLLQARRRLAMTGTPVENHLGELWSLFEFLNPGMLGRNEKLQESFSPARNRRAASKAESGGSKPDSDGQPAADLSLLSQALRPFMLRRTKQQVLSELPVKTEQTLYCELDADERKLYDELREHYRQSLLERVKKVGVNRSKIHVLEALLRLRQAACHPGLLDKKRATAGSSKLDTLLEQLTEIIAEGHKALVFSQFTSLLAIVRRHLDDRKIVYEYLDGKTTKRQEKVERFQTDPDCRLFLISLKAGGQGLNLTAADYVFILDPWWNPAVEAQAVDRAHRIGQDRPVFAYRLIARDTVEEKILQLQEKKRDLADAIISADNSPLRNLTAEDLQLLLG